MNCVFLFNPIRTGCICDTAAVFLVSVTIIYLCVSCITCGENENLLDCTTVSFKLPHLCFVSLNNTSLYNWPAIGWHDIWKLHDIYTNVFFSDNAIFRNIYLQIIWLSSGMLCSVVSLKLTDVSGLLALMMETVSLKLQSISVTSHGAISQKAVFILFVVARTWCLIYVIQDFC
jgi:hypothetical protein